MHWTTVAMGGASAAALAAVALMTGAAAPAAGPAPTAACGDPGGITLPPGFCATVFADDLGNVRHIAVGADGTLYANSWNGSTYFRQGVPPPQGFLIALPDANRDGKADKVVRFGVTPAEGSKGGTG